MKDRHLKIPADSDLLMRIYRQVDQDLVIDRKKFRLTIWSKLVFYLGISVISYTALLNIKNPSLFIVCFVLYGFSILLFAFNFAHDLSHGTVFKNPAWDTFFFTLIYTLNGAHAQAWKNRHINSHHFAPNVEHYDSDLKISSLIRVIPNSQRLWFHRFQHIYAPITYTTYSLFWVFVKDFAILFSKEPYQKKDFKYHLSFWLQKLFYISYILILPILFSWQPWEIILLGFVLMHLSQSVFLLFTFFMTHHVEGLEYPSVDDKGFIKTSWLMNQIKSSNDMYPFSRLANFIFGGFNNHIAHHLFPHIHHIFYPQLNRILYRILIQNSITPNETTYWGGICSHLKLLRRMARA